MAQENAAARCETGRGYLPSCAPLANPFVPYQLTGAELYKPAKGLVRGTMYPGLDLPFMGMVNQKEKPDTLLHRMQALGFAMQELGLFLDTHSLDSEALSLYQDYQEMYQELEAEYEKRYGPLTQAQAGGEGAYNWVNDPWPWSFDAQREG
ncbi:MAG: spore coat protein CotJB [Oscillospiraceae bacterium]|nr:spore coat protein CotJB [Oscillospiraceae bacterium]MBR2365928.1 spore coat protein CotJB [Oscillospiraceae bacterium]MBR2896919.1 spore coat protein CotJB [Oscillospiraceae bacterium]MBR2977996.1 spore coat protein CotJB [Oscillospiraceae bacterium]MBR3849756.1 spore coat protein CotJB [Oscillospiraceae bacterium]